MEKKKNKAHAQVIAEYSLAFGIVILAVIAMTFFIQRGFRARISDARQYTLDSLAQEERLARAYRLGILEPGQVWPDDPAQIGIPEGFQKILYEYEPYYRRQRSEADRKVDETRSYTRGVSEFKQTSISEIESFSQEAPAQDDFWKSGPIVPIK